MQDNSLRYRKWVLMVYAIRLFQYIDRGERNESQGHYGNGSDYS